MTPFATRTKRTQHTTARNHTRIAAPTGTRGGLFGAGGRFKGGTDPIMEKFNESINFDKR